jgi:DNA topoisomerase IB
MRLRRVDCTAPGFRRARRGRGFTYLEETGDPIDDAEVRDRIRGLAIPPAWTDVWICSDPRGHIQATGYDDAGRKQYLYHDAWREHRDRQRFKEMEEFAEVLPQLRERIKRDLRRRRLVRERVLACAVRLLDLGFFRIGSERYAAENETYGLATLKKRQLRIERGRAVFEYRAKGSKRHVQMVADRGYCPRSKR